MKIFTMSPVLAFIAIAVLAGYGNSQEVSSLSCRKKLQRTPCSRIRYVNCTREEPYCFASFLYSSRTSASEPLVMKCTNETRVNGLQCAEETRCMTDPNYAQAYKHDDGTAGNILTCCCFAKNCNASPGMKSASISTGCYSEYKEATGGSGWSRERGTMRSWILNATVSAILTRVSLITYSHFQPAYNLRDEDKPKSESDISMHDFLERTEPVGNKDICVSYSAPYNLPPYGLRRMFECELIVTMTSRNPIEMAVTNPVACKIVLL